MSGVSASYAANASAAAASSTLDTLAAAMTSSLGGAAPATSELGARAQTAATATAGNGGGSGWGILSLLRLLPWLLYWVITFATITLPTWLFTLASYSMTFTLNATTLLLILVAFASMVSWVVRYRFLNMYTRLPSEPPRKEPQIDLFTDVPDGDSKPGLSNYLDEFLSAIKVFGYLERPVFHELTRTMQTRKLIAGETLMLEEEKGFCLVVDGMVQIFVKSGRDSVSHTNHDHHGDATAKDEGHQDYQLLTEVKNGSPMSSLFSILSLFTEDVRLRHDDERPMTPGINGLGIHGNVPPLGTPGAMDPLKPPIEMDPSRPELRNVPPFSLDGEPMSRRPMSKDGDFRMSGRRMSKSYHPDIVARATTDTTIAIIPASAFKRLTRIYPKATAHIVQVILTRLQRVTLATAHSYLGLTSEVLQTEKLMDRYTTHDLPNHLRGSALERLKHKFNRERERLGADDDDTKGIALHNARVNARRRSSDSVRKDLAAQAKLAALRMSAKTPHVVPMSGQRESVSPGDLLGNLQAARRISQPPSISPEIMRHAQNGPFTPPRNRDRTPLTRSEHDPFIPGSPRMKLQRQESIDEDDMFRNSIIDCITKAIGLVSSKGGLHEASRSVEQSPRLVSFDARRNIGTFSNAFDFLGPFESSIDGETESMTSAAASGTGSVVSMETARAELADEIEIVYFPKGSVLVEQGERNPGLYYVIEGFLDVLAPEVPSPDNPGQTFDLSKSSSESTAKGRNNLLGTLSGATESNAALGSKPNANLQRKSLFDIKPGGLAGYVGTVSSYRSFVDVRAKTDVYVGFLPRASLERLVEIYPVVLLTMAKRLTSLLPRLLLHIDFALGWEQINAGDAVYHQGDSSDAIYIVLNGRLRAVTDKEKGKPRVTGEYGQGESVGELEVLTESVRPATLHAIRDTEVTRFPRSLFNSLALEHPGITLKISKIVARRMRALTEDPMFDQKTAKTNGLPNQNVTSSLNMRTVCILPVSNGVPVIEFGSRLLNALSQIGVANGVTSLNQAAILNHLGRHAFSKMGKLKLSAYLADLEERYGMLLYVADTNVSSPWTQTCISQADCILIVGLAESSPDIGDYERFLLGMKTTARKELVLLHIERYVPSGLTRRWLSNRLWINGGHHHVQMSFRNQSELTSSIQTPGPQRKLGTEIRRRVQVIQAEIQKYTSRRIRQTPLYSAETPFKGDFHRLARRLCGKSVGLVLGGGGARGISHVGVIRALEEAGIPIDIVGGTSIGSFIGGLYARDADLVPMYGRAKKFAGRMGSMWRFALDVTYPTASYTTGHEFNRGIFKAFGQSQMEDFWLDFYCNTTNISKNRSEIHRSGYAWRYIRASMTLAGLLPPLCDEGSMLLDGGYVDNLTVAHMKSLGADVVFAIDVGSIDDQTPQHFGDSLSGIWTVFNRWNPFSPYPNPPTLSEIQARLAYVSSHDALERAKATPGCLYMRPPVDGYGTLEFGKFEEIYQVGYRYGTSYLEGLRNKGVLPIMEETEEKRNLRRTLAPRRASV